MRDVSRRLVDEVGCVCGSFSRFEEVVVFVCRWGIRRKLGG